MIQTIRFGEWMPDLPALGNPGLTICKNVLPHEEGYLPAPALLPIGGALDGRCRGEYSARRRDGTIFNFAGDGTKLYKLNISTLVWDNVSKAGNYALGQTDNWRFTTYGNNVIAVGGINVPPQKFDLTSSSLFSDVGGSPPRADDVATVREFLFLCKTSDGTNYQHQRGQWSSINNFEGWTAGSSLSGFKDFVGDGGPSQRIIGGDYGVFVQEYGIWRLIFRGPPTVWQADRLDKSRGAIAAGSVAVYGSNIFFLAYDGFHMFDGANTVSIGNKKVDRYFLNDLDFSRMHLVYSAVDPSNRLVMWAYRSKSAATLEQCDRVIVYNFGVGRWTTFEPGEAFSSLGMILSPGMTLENLNSFSTDLDTLSLTMDSPYWDGGFPQMIAFNSSHKMSYLGGASLAAQIETGEMELSNGRRSVIREVTPFVDGGTPTNNSVASIQIGTRQRQQDAVTYRAEVNQNAGGRCPQRANARFHRVRLNVAAGVNYNKIVGCSMDHMPVGGVR